MRQRNEHEQKLALFVLDMLAFFVALHVAILLRFYMSLPFSKTGPPPWRELMLAFPYVAIVWLVVGAFSGSYRLRQSPVDEIAAVVKATLITFSAVLSTTFFYRTITYSRGMIAFFIPMVIVFVVVGRLGFRALRRRVLVRFAGRSKVAILGQSKVGHSLVNALLGDQEYYEVMGVILTHREPPIETLKQAAGEPAPGESAAGEPPARDPQAGEPAAGLPILGTLGELDSLCARHGFDTLILVDRNLPEPALLHSIEVCIKYQVTWNMIPGVHDLLLDRAHVDLVEGIPLVGMRRTNIVGFNWLAKRIFDIVVASVLLAVLGPLMLLVSLAIKLSSRGPIFYVQSRVGYRGQQFSFLKFRSMHVGNDDAIHREYTRKWITQNQAHTTQNNQLIHKIVGDPRIFAVGRFIRKYSIDELPQLINVLRGEMSLIGPRPAIPYEVDVYREWHRRRFEAPPGITGLWQVSGRNRLTFDEMIKLDIDYLENWSFLRDIQILWRTVRVVLFEHAH